MTGTNEQQAEQRIASRLPLRVAQTGWKAYWWIGWILLAQAPFVFWSAASSRMLLASIRAQLIVIAAALLLGWLFMRFAAAKWRVLAGYDVVVTEHEFQFRSDGSTIPYIEVRKIEMYMSASVWMHLHDDREVCFTIAGFSKEDRPLLLAWLQRRIGADVFA